MRDKKKTVDMGPMHYRVHLVMTDDVLKARRKIDSLVGEYDGEPVLAMHSYDDEDMEQSWIILPHRANPGLIAHEVFHAVMRIFRCMNAEMEEEVFAYTLQFLVKEVIKLQFTSSRGEKLFQAKDWDMPKKFGSVT
jgi:hypothetical protein